MLNLKKGTFFFTFRIRIRIWDSPGSGSDLVKIPGSETLILGREERAGQGSETGTYKVIMTKVTITKEAKITKG